MVKVENIGESGYRVEIDGIEALVLNDVSSQLHLPKKAVINFFLTGCLQEDDKNILLERNRNGMAGQG